ncbi:sugar phosphate isomerase [Tersicoccus solisilvae]|uniref:Sugar phosphate isomerase n=1 Tax=Tersicoccus solisilvae TaxID=1882339 RepID=A0ABQ1NMT0_9MICC|nr:sugar phosphate isomerase/epimerase family protein [Tersicoccus solisilvae]GGC81068.1 sugar phosphate isomerase [Tersicoccus solisilvae]
MSGPGDIPVGLSTSSVYPLTVVDTFAMAHDVGYDGVEVMVTNNSVSRDPSRLRDLRDHYQLPILSVHAPTLLLTQQVWGTAWTKVELSCAMAAEVGAPTVVVHPPFRWQTGYADHFATGIRRIMADYGVTIAVENMYPWRVRGRDRRAYLPHWDPVPLEYEHVTWDFSHAACAGSHSLRSVQELGSRLRHVHLTDGSGAQNRDEHLLPGEGNQDPAAVLRHLAATAWDGTVIAEVSTRKAKGAGEREQLLGDTLSFARRHLDRAGQPDPSSLAP